MSAAPPQRPPTIAPPLPTVTRLPTVGPTELAHTPLSPSPLPVSAAVLRANLRTALAAGEASLVRQRLVDGLAAILGAEQIALGWQSSRSRQWQGVLSGQGRIDHKTPAGRAWTAAFAETALGEGLRRWQSPLPVPISYRQLATSLGKRSVIGIPLPGPTGVPAGVILLLNPSDQAERAASALLADDGPALAGLIQLCAGATPSHIDTVLKTLHRYLAVRKKLVALAVAAVLAAAACLPVSDRVWCSATLEPSVRRFIGAPFDGKLERALVKVGDAVAVGQTVAVLDKRPLEIELSVHQAQLEEAAKRAGAARAKGQATQTQLAELEVAQIERQIEQLQHQLEQLTITSPLAGIVVRGELQRVEGAPVSRGQNLFEIAPLSPLIAELGIPEDEVRLVRSGANTFLRPLALPGTSLTGTIDQIHPRAELRDGQMVFIAEVALDNADGQLRPGMQARAVAYGSRQPLAWTLIRRPFTRLYRALWW